MSNELTYDKAKAQANELRIRQVEAGKQKEIDDEKWAEEAMEENLDSEDLNDEGPETPNKEKQDKSARGKSSKSKKKVSARKRALVRKIIKKIRKERFDGGAFYSALFLAMFNDIFTVFSNIFTAGAANVVLIFTTEPLLGIILWRSGSSKIDMKLKRIGITSILGMVPIISLFPTHSLAIGYIKFQQDNKVMRLRVRLRKLRKK